MFTLSASLYCCTCALAARTVGGTRYNIVDEHDEALIDNLIEVDTLEAHADATEKAPTLVENQPNIPEPWKGSLTWVEELGAGSSAAVHKVSATCGAKANEGRDVAMKVFYEDETTRGHLGRELDAIKDMSMPEHRSDFVSSILGDAPYEDESGKVFILMEYLNQGDLLDILYDDDRMKAIGGLGAFYALFVQILLGLRAMHRAGWVHMDVKLQNVAVDCQMSRSRRHCWAQVIDLGAAVRINNPNGVGIFYTKEYLAPEMARAFMLGEEFPVEPSYDVYATGVMMYRTYYGEHPPCTNDDVTVQFRCLANWTRNRDPHLQSACQGRGTTEAVHIGKAICAMMHEDPQGRLTVDEAIVEIKKLALWVGEKECRKGKSVAQCLARIRSTVQEMDANENKAAYRKPPPSCLENLRPR